MPLLMAQTHICPTPTSLKRRRNPGRDMCMGTLSRNLGQRGQFKGAKMGHIMVDVSAPKLGVSNYTVNVLPMVDSVVLLAFAPAVKTDQETKCKFTNQKC